MVELRRYERFSVEGIHGNMLFTSEIRILNISIGGVAIETTKRLNIGGEYTVKLQGESGTISVRGKVVWSELSCSRKGPREEVVPVYRTGLQFVDAISESVGPLIDFIESHKKTPEGRLDGLRFEIHAPRAVLSVPSHYKVKKISEGGMLIESAERYELEERYPMELFIPAGISGPYGSGSKVIGFIGRVASCIEVLNSNPKCYDIGIEFVEMSEISKKNLQDFIATLKKPSEIS